MRIGKFFDRRSEVRTDFETQPRAYHYQFAHRFLPGLARQQGTMLVGGRTDAGAHDGLYALWNWMGEKLQEEDRMAPDGLNFTARSHGENIIILFILPPPRAVTEAYFTALALPRSAIDAEVKFPFPIRYITLEYGFSLTPDEKRTVLGEWAYNEEGVSHLNMGTGLEPDLEAFYNRVCVLTE